MDAAVATQSAYNAQLAGLQASKMALETEKKAYTDAEIEAQYQQVNEVLLPCRKWQQVMAWMFAYPADISMR
ncbi:MAG: hypothetical protein ACLUD0_20615 [Eubacterium ramulus]